MLSAPDSPLDDTAAAYARKVAAAVAAEGSAAFEAAYAQAFDRALATLRRGYAVLQGPDGHVVTSVDGVAPGAEVSVRVADGRVHATTTRLEPLLEHPASTSPTAEDEPDG